MALCFDIETLGTPAAELPPEVQATITRGMTPEQAEKALLDTALSSFTGTVACIACRDTEKDQALVLLATTAMRQEEIPDIPGVSIRGLPGEREVLEKFWDVCSRQRSFVTFNGRGFDVPFLVHRSAVHDLRPFRPLVRATRFAPEVHLDLKDYVENFGGYRPRFNLDLLCRSLNVPTSKGDITGANVGDAWLAGRYLDIGMYCLRDVDATVACAAKFGFVTAPNESKEPPI